MQTYFFKLQNFGDYLKEWTRLGHLQEQVSNKLDEWFKDGLREWDISRDAPYFGFAIPGTTDKYFYVWLDAPVGYIGSFLNLCKRREDLIKLAHRLAMLINLPTRSALTRFKKSSKLISKSSMRSLNLAAK